jgi:NAD(P)-dependent dehydrogenase (short-subunit alcohol dehydrogenase family)
MAASPAAWSRRRAMLRFGDLGLVQRLRDGSPAGWRAARPAMVHAAVAEFGRLDLVVLNAGIPGPHARLDQLGAASERYIIPIAFIRECLQVSSVQVQSVVGQGQVLQLRGGGQKAGGMQPAYGLFDALRLRVVQRG